jgi:excisionase family DNA binding protein
VGEASAVSSGVREYPERNKEYPMDGRLTAAPEFEPITVSIVTAAAMLGISRSKFYELLEAGDIEGIRIGSRKLIPVSTLREFVEARQSK